MNRRRFLETCAAIGVGAFVAPLATIEEAAAPVYESFEVTFAIDVPGRDSIIINMVGMMKDGNLCALEQIDGSTITVDPAPGPGPVSLSVRQS